MPKSPHRETYPDDVPPCSIADVLAFDAWPVEQRQLALRVAFGGMTALPDDDDREDMLRNLRTIEREADELAANARHIRDRVRKLPTRVRH